MKPVSERLANLTAGTCLAAALLAACVALPYAALATPVADTDGAIMQPINQPITQPITQQLHRYEQALNASNTDAIMTLYDDAPVVMAQSAPPAVGRAAVRDAYTRAFGNVRLNVRFKVDEIVPMSRDWAFVRTRSTGTIEQRAGQRATLPEANQELFIWHRGPDGVWRVARYIFSTTLPSANG